jgi:hypothetical protein
MKTIVTHKISRKIQTAQFESLEVVSGFEEEVNYESESDLVQKSNAIADRTRQQLTKDLNDVLTMLGVEEKRAFVKSPGPSRL